MRWRRPLVLGWTIILFGSTAPVSAGGVLPGGTFVDDDGIVHEGFIEAIAAEKITEGCNPPVNDMYCPGDFVTRAQMATFLARALGLLPADDDGDFTDHLSSVHRQNINAVRIAGITQGCNPPDNTLYCPGDFVTRAQMGTFLAKALGLAPSDDDGAFVDHVGLVHRKNINAIRIAGITLGCNPPANTLYCPGEFVTRAQMATFLGRALGLTPMTPPPRFTYSTPQVVPGIGRPIGILPSAVADFNVDRNADIIIAPNTGFNSGPASAPLFLINDGGNGLVDRTAEFIDGPVPEFFVVRDLLVEDFNGDGRPDIYFNNHGKEGPLGEWASWPCEQNRLLLSQPDGRLRDVTATNLPIAADFSHGSTAADIDGDSDIDIWVNNLGICSDAVPGYLLQNDGQGDFTVVADAGDLWPPEENQPLFWAQFVDANGDGVGDLMYLNHGAAGLLLNDGSGVFAEVPENWIPAAAVGWTTQDSHSVDLSGDGFDDIVLYQTPDDFSPGHALQILISNGDGSFTDETAQRLPPQDIANSCCFPIFWARDLEGDGDTDLLILKFGPGFGPEEDIFDFYLNGGDGAFQELPPDQLPPIRPVMIPIDVNGDEKVDFVFSNDGFEGGVLAMTLAL